MNLKQKTAFFQMILKYPNILNNEFITVNGNSMYPSLVDGQKVRINTSNISIKKGDIIDVGYIAGCLLGGMNKYQIADYRNFTAFTTILQLRNDKTRREIIVKI